MVQVSEIFHIGFNQHWSSNHLSNALKVTVGANIILIVLLGGSTKRVKEFYKTVGTFLDTNHNCYNNMQIMETKDNKDII